MLCHNCWEKNQQSDRSTHILAPTEKTQFNMKSTNIQPNLGSFQSVGCATAMLRL